MFCCVFYASIEESIQIIELIPVINMNSKVFKWCAVPQCKNTTKKTPNKVFVHVPNKKIIRHRWVKLARGNLDDVFSNSTLYFCEDHFDLPNDMANYMEYHVMGSVSQVRMIPGCMPHKFKCQPDRRPRRSDTTERPYIAKKRKMMILEECRKEFEEKSIVSKGSSFGAITSVHGNSISRISTPESWACAEKVGASSTSHKISNDRESRKAIEVKVEDVDILEQFIDENGLHDRNEYMVKSEMGTNASPGGFFNGKIHPSSQNKTHDDYISSYLCKSKSKRVFVTEYQVNGVHIDQSPSKLNQHSNQESWEATEVKTEDVDILEQFIDGNGVHDRNEYMVKSEMDTNASSGGFFVEKFPCSSQNRTHKEYIDTNLSESNSVRIVLTEYQINRIDIDHSYSKMNQLHT